MEPARLVEELIRLSGKPLTAVAVEIGGRSFQGTLYKFVHLGTKSPRHETASRIAHYFGIPLEALFDRAAAAAVAKERGISLSAPMREAPPPPHVSEPVPMYARSRKGKHHLSDGTTARIADLTAQQFRALESLVISYLDTVAPAQQTAGRQA